MPSIARYHKDQVRWWIRLLWRLKEVLYSGPLECRWRTASYKETAARSSAGTHFQGAGFKRILLRRRHAARQGEWTEPALGSSVRWQVLVGSLKYIISCPLIVAHRVNIVCGDSAASILREETGIRLRRRFASLEMGWAKAALWWPRPRREKMAASVAERPMAAPQVAPRAPALCMLRYVLWSCVVRPRLSSTRAI